MGGTLKSASARSQVRQGQYTGLDGEGSGGPRSMACWLVGGSPRNDRSNHVVIQPIVDSHVPRRDSVAGGAGILDSS